MKGLNPASAIRTPGILLLLIRNIRKQRKFLHQLLGPQLQRARDTADGTLDDADFKKITTYYGLAVPAILGEAFCVLRGKPMTLKERKASTYLGALTGLFDDFFDKHELTDDILESYIEKSENYTGDNAREKLFFSLHREGLPYFENHPLMTRFQRRVYHAQVESRKQSIPGRLAQQEIKDLTIEKGGVSVLYYRSIFSHVLTAEEETALYHLGGLMQFGNDIFDVYKDAQQKIDTLVTTSTDISSVRSSFNEMKSNSFGLFYKTHYKPQDIRKFLRMVSLSLTSRCQVCLDQLERVQGKSGRKLTVEEFTRQQLVCDMDTPKNKWKSVKYYMQEKLGR